MTEVEGQRNKNGSGMEGNGNGTRNGKRREQKKRRNVWGRQEDEIVFQYEPIGKPGLRQSNCEFGERRTGADRGTCQEYLYAEELHRGVHNQ